MMSSVITANSVLSDLPLLSVEEALDCDGLMRAGVDPESAGALADCARWTTTYPLKKVKKLRREEAICPMMAPALAARAVYFSAKRVNDRELVFEALDEILREAATVFEEKIIACDPRLRCLVLVLPGVRGSRLLEATDPAREIKNELLRRGILVGEFFPGCPFATTFNPQLFALRSPAPMYVLRSFIESDWRFICKIPAWQRTYRDRFGEPPIRLRHLGGRLWRFQQKIAWRVEALKKRFFSHSADPVDLDS